MSKHEYWLYREGKDVCDRLIDFHTHWYSWHGSPFKQMWLRNYYAYYSPVLHPSAWDTSLIFEGIQGELTRFYTPKARTLIRQLTSVVTKQRLAFKASAQTDGADAINEIKLGNAVAEQVVDSQRLDIKGDQLCEGGLVCGAWFTKATWDTAGGTPYTKDASGRIINTGSVNVSIHSPFNVFYNLMVPWDDQPWVEVRVKKNRWDLIAEHPDLEREIKSIPSVNEENGPNNWIDRQLLDEDDLIYCYEFFHKPTPSLPKGRMIFYTDSETIFYDGPNKYGAIPVEPNIPEAVLDTGTGYSKLTDLSGCQEMFDASLSAVATNQSQFAVQNVLNPRGSNVQVDEINGMNFISYTPVPGIPGGGAPTPLNLTKSAPETFKFTDKLEDLMQDLSFISGAMTGNLPPGVSSGTAIATLSANSIEFITSISKSYNLCWEKTMMHAVNAYKKFAKIPQKVELKGKGGQLTYRDFKGEDISNVSSMKLETVNPLLKSFAGRLEVGEKLLTVPKDIWPDYVSILEGRPLDSIYKNELNEGDLIAQENEALEMGEMVPVLATDDHLMHMKDHSGCLSDIKNRLNGKSVQTILQHIMDHYKQLKQGDPVLMGIMKTGQMPEGGLQPPAPPPPPPPPAGPGGPPIPGAVDEPAPAGIDAPTSPVVGDVAQPATDLLQRG